MKKYLVVALVVVVLAVVVVPSFAFGGFGMRGQRGNATPQTVEEHNQWIDQQVKDGWMTQKQADYMKKMYEFRLNGVSEKDYFAWIDQQVKDGWMTTKQADYLKESYKLNKERFGENAPIMGRMMGQGCPQAGMGGCGMGRSGMMGRGGMGRGMMGRSW